MKYMKLFEDINWEEDWEEEDPDIGDIPSGKSYEFYVQYVGREVMIKKDSEYYGGQYDNPKDKTGIIDRIGGLVYSLHQPYEHIIDVKWSRYNINVYRPEDLVLVD